VRQDINLPDDLQVLAGAVASEVETRKKFIQPHTRPAKNMTKSRAWLKSAETQNSVQKGAVCQSAVSSSISAHQK
jgi:hypothetical protein